MTYEVTGHSLGIKLSRRAFFATGKNAKPSRAKFRDQQSADWLLSQFFFIFSAWVLGKAPCWLCALF